MLLRKPPGRNIYTVRLTGPDGRVHDYSTRSADIEIARANAKVICDRLLGERRYLSRTGRSLPKRRFRGIAPMSEIPAAAGVYWAFCPLLANYVKIGWASNVKRRLRHLQTGLPGPLLLLKYAPGTKADESAVHARLSAHRRMGEWFVTCPEVLETIIGDTLFFTGDAA